MTRSVHATIAILPTGGFIDACLLRANGEVPVEKIDRSNCDALAAMVQLVPWPNQDIDKAMSESSYVPMPFQARKHPGVETRLKLFVYQALQDCITSSLCIGGAMALP